MDEQAGRGPPESRHGSRREERREKSEGSRLQKRDLENTKEREELRLVPPPRKHEKTLVSPRSQKSGGSRRPQPRSEKRRSWNASDHAAQQPRKERGPKVRKVAPEDVPSITAPERRGFLSELILGQWEKRYCVLKDGHFKTFKAQEDTTEESDTRMRSANLKEFQGEPDRQMCFSLNGRVFRAEDDYDLVEWVFAVTGAMQYYAIMQKVKDAINSKAIDKTTVLRKMPSLRLAVEDQFFSPRSARAGSRPLSGYSPAGINISAAAAAAAEPEPAERTTPRGSRRGTDTAHPSSSSTLTPRGSNRHSKPEETAPTPTPSPAAEPPALSRTDSEVPPPPPSMAHITLPQPQPEEEPAAPKSGKNQKLQRSHKAEEKAAQKAEEKVRRAEEKAERKAKKDEEKKMMAESRKSKTLERQSSAPNLRAAMVPTVQPTQYSLMPPPPAALVPDQKFNTVAVSRSAAVGSIQLPPEAEPITVTTTPATVAKPDGKHKQGHVLLLKKALTIPNWRKRYLSYANGSLSIQKKETGPVSISLNMLFCSCKLGAKGRNGKVYVFEVVSPRKTYFVSVNSAADLRDWVELLQGAQAELMTQTLYASMTQLPVDGKDTSDKDGAEARRLLKEIRDNPENSVCADCNAEDPAWVSLNLGVFLCIECGGIHRKLGTHVSQLRSVALDHLKLDQVQTLKAMGTNQQLNRKLYEAQPSPVIRKPGPDATAEDRETYIKHKYVSRTFAPANAP